MPIINFFAKILDIRRCISNEWGDFGQYELESVTVLWQSMIRMVQFGSGLVLTQNTSSF